MQKLRLLGKKGHCSVKGCNTRGKWRKGGNIRRRLCDKHYKELVPTAFNDAFKRKLRASGFTDKCSICGWDKAKCDIHRLIPKSKGGKYEKSNVISVCPNCHRILHNR